MRGGCALAVTAFLSVTAVAQAKSVDDAVMDCLFTVKGSEYLAVSISGRGDAAKIKYLKSKRARKDKVGDAQLDKVKSDMTACVTRQMRKR